jgi:hypothetical protein
MGILTSYIPDQPCLTYTCTNPLHPKHHYFLCVLSATLNFPPCSICGHTHSSNTTTPIDSLPESSLPTLLSGKATILECLDPEDRGSKLLQNVGNYFTSQHVISQKTWIFIINCALMWTSMLWISSLVFYCSSHTSLTAKTMYRIYVSIFLIC